MSILRGIGWAVGHAGATLLRVMGAVGHARHHPPPTPPAYPREDYRP